jgi:hypothetical protein
MKTAFLSEMGFNGKVPAANPNMRTEFAWMYTLQSDHFNIHQYEQVKGYDAVFIIFPKATVKLNAVGVEMKYPAEDKDISIYSKPIVTTLKMNNTKVCNVQEGPSWFFNEYDMVTQFNFYNQLSECDVLFAHNEYDTHFYMGMFPQAKVRVIPSLIIANDVVSKCIPTKEPKAIIGGNFCRWYGGFQSYVVATEFDCPIFVPSMHCKRPGEEAVPNLKHLPYMSWNDWMLHLSTYSFAVHLMPTVAAGTFSLNCAYFGIPCIGNEKVDTQTSLFPGLSVNVDDVYDARFIAIELRNNKQFYDHASAKAKQLAMESYHVDSKKWLAHMEEALS